MKEEEKRQYVANRLLEHYNFLESKGYEIVCLMLQGSQNYDLDLYTEEYKSDIDSKAIVLPHFRDFVKSKQPVSYTEVLDNNEHAEVKDIRVMFEMFRKMNISYIELLFSDYIIINPKYEDLILDLFRHRARIAAFNKSQFVRCIHGMALEKRKALCHPYPATADKIAEFGYDGKQLSHCVRLYYFLRDYKAGKSIAQAFKPAEKDYLINLKMQKDEKGNRLDVTDAIALADEYCRIIQEMKDEMIAEFGDGVDGGVIDILDEICYKVLERRFSENILGGRNEEYK
ncbi:hypothetical protein IKJ53_05515 [bacterium]|nr:hypothetical protein [bacterium]